VEWLVPLELLVLLVSLAALVLLVRLEKLELQELPVSRVRRVLSDLRGPQVALASQDGLVQPDNPAFLAVVNKDPLVLLDLPVQPVRWESLVPLDPQELDHRAVLVHRGLWVCQVQQVRRVIKDFLGRQDLPDRLGHQDLLEQRDLLEHLVHMDRLVRLVRSV